MWPAVSWLCRRPGLSCRSTRLPVSQRTPGHVAMHVQPYRMLCRAHRVTEPPTRAVASIAASYVVSWRFPHPCRARIATQPSGQAVCLSRYAHSYHDTIPEQPGPRATGSPCSRADHIAAFLSHVVTSPHRVARSYRGRALLVQASLCSPVSRYSLLYRDSKQRMGSSPSSCL